MIPARAPEERPEEEEEGAREGRPEETMVEAGRAEVIVEVPTTMTVGWERV